MNILDQIVDLYYAAKFKAEDLVFVVKDKVNAILGRDEFAYLDKQIEYVAEEEIKPKKRGRKPGKKTGKKKK